MEICDASFPLCIFSILFWCTTHRAKLYLVQVWKHKVRRTWAPSNDSKWEKKLKKKIQRSIWMRLPMLTPWHKSRNQDSVHKELIQFYRTSAAEFRSLCFIFVWSQLPPPPLPPFVVLIHLRCPMFPLSLARYVSLMVKCPCPCCRICRGIDPMRISLNLRFQFSLQHRSLVSIWFWFVDLAPRFWSIWYDGTWLMTMMCASIGSSNGDVFYFLNGSEIVDCAFPPCATSYDDYCYCEANEIFCGHASEYGFVALPAIFRNRTTKRVTGDAERMHECDWWFS